MRNYEVLYIVKPDLDEEQNNAVIEKFNTLIADNGGEDLTVDKWGKRRMAYEIKDYREGFYVLLHFKGEAKTAQELDRVMKITDEVLRFMILRKEE